MLTRMKPTNLGKKDYKPNPIRKLLIFIYDYQKA